MATNCKHPLTTLYKTERGVVFQCSGCNHYNVVFGPLILPHDEPGLMALKHLIDTLEPERDPSTHIGKRCYHLRAADGQVGLAFTHDEVEELRALLAGAAAMNELNGMLKTTTLGSDASVAEA